MVSDDNHVANYIRLWGNSSSIALFDPGCQFFSLDGIDGVIGYRMKGGCVVALGEPLCQSKDLPTLTTAFHQHFQKQEKPIIYATVSEPFAHWAMKNNCKASIEVGDELILDPLLQPPKGAEGRLVKQKANQAARHSITVHEYADNNPITEAAIEEVGKAWLKGRHGPQIYLAHVLLFGNRIGRRWFYAEQGGKIIGVVLLNRLEKREGWLLNLVLVTPEAVNGTTELLVVSVLETLAMEKCRFLTIGMMTASELREIIGLGKVSTWMARKCYKVAKKIFGLDQKRKYWDKFKPRTEPSYLLFSGAYVGHKEIRGLMNAFNVSINI